MIITASEKKILQEIKESCKISSSLQDRSSSCKKGQGLTRAQNFLQDFDLKNLAY